MKRVIENIRTIFKRMPDTYLLIALSVIVGISVGVACEVMKHLITAIQHMVETWRGMSSVNYLFLLTPVVGIVLTILFVRFFVKDNISHGITRVFYAISRKESRIKKHNCYSSVVSSSLTIGFGGSVGAEAPIVLTGAAIGSNIGQFLGLKYNYITLLLGCGAAAAIAAAYKAPIAGFIFVIEVLMMDLTYTSVAPLLVASISAATMTYILRGVDPFFGAYIPDFKLHNMYYYGILGVLGGVVSRYFSYTTVKLEGALSKFSNAVLKILLAGVVIGGLVFIFPPLYGEGYSTIEKVLMGHESDLLSGTFFSDGGLGTLALFVGGMLLFKVVAMTFTNAAGGVGGTFAPSLFVGAMTGLLFALVMNNFFGLQLPLGSFTLVGMAVIMSGVMKAPLTSIFLVAELTGGFQLFLPLMLATILSYAVSYYFGPYSIYTMRLASRGELLTHDKDGNTMQMLDINEFIEADFISVNENAMLRDLIVAVESSRRNIFPVVSSEGLLVGLVTLDSIRMDMFDRNLWDVTPISQYMVIPADTIVVNEDARSVAEKFENSRLWNLPVVDAHGYYRGFISKSRLLTEYRRLLKKMTLE